jgi:hypothetical protein
MLSLKLSRVFSLSAISLHVDIQTCSRFYVIALVFWYGSRLVSTLQFSNFDFFIALMVGGLYS